MSLLIYLGEVWPFERLPGEPYLVLEDDGYYWFLYPVLERLHDATGQMVDLL